MRAITQTLDTAPALRALIAAVPADRLRDLVHELVLRDLPSEAPAVAAPALVHTVPAQAPAPAEPAVPKPTPARRARKGWPKGVRRGSRNGTLKSTAGGDYSAVRRQHYAEKQAANKAQAANGNGDHDAPDEDEGITAEVFWAHAKQLSPQDPCRAVVRELGSSERSARDAQKTMALPFGVATSAVARFLAISVKEERAAAR